MKKFTLKTIAAFSMMATLLFFSCTKTDTSTQTVTAPTLTTSPITQSAAQPFLAVSGGNITSAGNGTITAYGICYSSTNQLPDLTCLTTNDGSGTAAVNYYSYMVGLSPGTTYYVRAYATNSAGTAYGNLFQVTTTPASWTTQFFTGGTDLKALSGISFSDDNNGWAYGIDVNNKAVLLSSSDAGTTWTTNTVTTGGAFSLAYNGAYLPTKNKSICFTSVNNGWIVYGGDSVLETQNGGVSWALIPYTTATPVVGQGLSSLCFANVPLGFVAGLGIYKATGSLTWTNPASASTYFNSVYFLDANTGFASSNTGIYKSTDGGNTWVNIGTTSSAVYGFNYVNNAVNGAGATLYAGGTQGVYISTDLGATWISHASPNGVPLYNMCFINQNYGVVATQTGLYQTYDGGNTWAVVVPVNSSAQTGIFNDVCKTSNHIFAISGTSILKM